MQNGPIKVLIIEDSPEQAKLLKTILMRSKIDFQLEHVTSAEVGLNQLHQFHFDIILMDYTLPGMDGLQAIGEIKNRGFRLPIVMVTGQGNERVAVKAMKLGANDYIVKDSELLKTLPRVLQRVLQDCWLKQKLAVSEQRYRELFEKASDSIAIVRPSDLMMVEINSMMEKLLGYDRAELTQKTLLDICAPLLHDRLKTAIHNILVQGSLHFDFVQFVHQSGRSIPVDINASQIDNAGRPEIQMFIRDITERKKLQQQILIDRRRLLSLFDGITDPISVIDRNCNLVMVNKKYADLAHSTPRAVVGKNCHKILFHRGHRHPDCPIQQTFITVKSHFHEIIQHQQTYHIWTFPMFGLDGKPEFVVEYAKDVTEQKNMEQQLIKSEKLATIGILSSGIAHELRNPLNIIETARYSIEQSIPGSNKEVWKNLVIIQKSIRRASRIIENLLQFSRHSDKEREYINIPELLDVTLSFFDKEISLHRIELVRNYESDLKAFFNLDSLKQVLLNVIMNAIQAMPYGGRLTITTKVDEKNLLNIIIQDNGIGIRPEDMPHIFSPFFTTKKAGEGTGLGLYVSYSIIKREGGDILVESSPGVKTIFNIKIPVKSK